MEIHGKIVEGKFVPTNKELFKEAFREHEGKGVIISVKRATQRTCPQNAYYWGVIVELITKAINELGNDFAREIVHELLKKQFLKKERQIINKETGEVKVISYICSTTKLNTTEFATYIDNCIAFAAEKFSIYIPLPNE